MKQILVAAGIALVALSTFSSCKRTFHCSCTTTVMINDSVGSVSTTKEEMRTTKNRAKNRCADASDKTIAGGDTTTTTVDCMFE